MEIFRLPFLGKTILNNDKSLNDMILVPTCSEKNRKGDQICDFTKNIWGNSEKFKELMSCKLVTYIDYKNDLCENEYDVTPLENDKLDDNDIGKYFVINLISKSN